MGVWGEGPPARGNGVGRATELSASLWHQAHASTPARRRSPHTRGTPPLATPRPLLGHRDGRRQGGWLGLCRQLWEWDSSHTLPVAARTQSGMPFKARAPLCSASKMA